MILVDTSVWVDHFRGRILSLPSRLEDGEVLVHPLIIGELACGHLTNRKQILSLLKNLPEAPSASNEEALDFLERHRLAGRGLGWIDVHLLASTKLTAAVLWTSDRRLALAAKDLKLEIQQ